MSGFNGTAATPVNSNAASKQRDVLSVYSKAQVDSAIQQSTAGEAWSIISPISSNFTSGDIRYKKIGNVVYLTAYSLSTTKTGSVDICTMPSGYRTAARWTVKASYPFLPGDSYINITTNGAIQFINMTGGAVNNLYFTTVYPAM